MEVEASIYRSVARANSIQIPTSKGVLTEGGASTRSIILLTLGRKLLRRTAIALVTSPAARPTPLLYVNVPLSCRPHLGPVVLEIPSSAILKVHIVLIKY